MENPTALQLAEPNMATLDATKYVHKTVVIKGLFIFLNYPIIILDFGIMY